MGGQFSGDQILLFGGGDVRTVNREEGLARSDRLVGRIREHLLNPAGEAKLHVGEPRLIGFDIADGADVFTDRAALDHASLHADALHALRAERHRRQLRFGGLRRSGLRRFAHGRRHRGMALRVEIRPQEESDANRGQNENDRRRDARPRDPQRPPPMRRSIPASATCSSTLIWSSLSSRSWTRC